MTKIFQYYDGYYRASGGIETHISDIVQNLNYEFEIITDALPGYLLFDQIKNTRIRRFKPYNYNIASLNSGFLSRVIFPYRVLADWRRVHNKYNYLKRAEFDLLHVHGLNVSGSIFRLSNMLGTTKLIDGLTNFSFIKKPMLLTLHGLSCLLTNNSLSKKIETKYLEQFENIICVDKRLFSYVKKLGEKTGRKNIWYISNWVDTKKFYFVPHSQGEKLKVGFIGRLEKSRGISLLYDLINNLPSYVDLYVIGAGNSVDINRFKSKTDVSKIHFYTNVNYNEIPRFYQKIDVLLNPVIAEGMSKATLEAMASGRPSIMIDKGDRYPVINKKTGYLVGYNISHLITLLEYLHDNRREIEKIGRNARRIVEKEFDRKIIMPRIQNVYEFTLNKSK